jgi:hypothetical protein
MKKRLLISSLVASFLIGCGGNSSSSSSGDSTESGTYEDAPVAGLTYETTSGITGLTDSNGTFKYKAGDKVTFKIGNVVLGSVEGKKVITPYDSGLDEAQKIAYVLQNLDTDGNPTNDVIKLPSKEVLAKYLNGADISDITANIKTIKTNIETNLSKKWEDITETQALKNLQNYVIKKINDNLTKDVLKNGLLGLKNKKLYGVNNNQFSLESFDVDYTNDSYKFVNDETGKIDEIKPIKWDKDIIVEPVDEEGDQNVFKLLKVDVANGLVYIEHNYGVIALSSSKEVINNYKKELESKYLKTQIDPKSIKGKYLYFISDNAMEIEATKLTDNNKLEYEGEENKVYKISLTNKTIDAEIVGRLFDGSKLSNMFEDLGLKDIKFTKGNAYCLSEDNCAIDQDAMKVLYSAVMTINNINAIKKGEAKTPKYSKISDYLKEKDYYNVDTESAYLDYEKNYINGDKVDFNEIETLNGTPWNQEMNLSDLDSAVKILSEYDNGILVEIIHDGFDFKQFLYNNEDDAKAEYDKLLPIYQKYISQN